MPGPMGEKCEDCYWFELMCKECGTGWCQHSSIWCRVDMEDEWCEHFEDREERKRGIESIREISRRLDEMREQEQNELLDKLGIGKGKVN